MAVPQETLVMGESTQEVLEVQAVLTMPVPVVCSSSLLHDACARVELDADGVPLGAISIEADGEDPWPCEDVGSPLRDMVVHSAGQGMPNCTIPGDVMAAPGPQMLWARG
jgi:hypothetical protein